MEGTKTYVGVKLINARPLTRGEYNKYKHWQIPADENPNDEGYLVQYKDDYVSWSPKEVFDQSHIEVIKNDELKTDKPSISPQMIEDFIDKIEVVSDGPKTTIVKVTLKNGFVRVESSSCVSPENYDSETGIKICVDKVKDQMWGFLGFLLQTATHGVKGE